MKLRYDKYVVKEVKYDERKNYEERNWLCTGWGLLHTRFEIADFLQKNLDSNIKSCIIILTEPTTPLIFHAQSDGTFLFMGCFMYHTITKSLTITQYVMGDSDVGVMLKVYTYASYDQGRSR